jgi:hypothetical protein
MNNILRYSEVFQILIMTLVKSNDKHKNDKHEINNENKEDFFAFSNNSN